MNIQIRVIKAQAESQIKSLQSEIKALQTQMRTGATGASFLDSTNRSASSLALNLRSAGYALLTTFTGPVLSAGRTLLQSYMDNQKAAADLQKVYGTDPTKDYRASLDKLQVAFSALSTEFGVSQSEVTGIAASWAAAGLQGTALAQAVQNTLRAVVIGDMSAADATTALIAVQAAYGENSKQLGDTLNILNAVENATPITMQGLIQGFQRAASSAAGAGIDVRHLAADLAAITPAAGTATQAGNALKTIIDKILVSSSKAAPLLAQMGIDVNSVGWTSLTAQDRLEQLAVSFSHLNQQQKAQVSTAVANLYQINRFDQLMQDMANSLNNVQGATSNYGAALKASASPTQTAAVANRELQVALSSQPQLLAEIGNALKNQLMDTIKPLIPVILSMADALLQFAQWFGRLNPNIQKFVGIAILALAVLGPILLYISALGSAVHYFGDVLGLVVKPFSLFLGLFGGGAEGDMAATEAALAKLDGSLNEYAANAARATAEVSASNEEQTVSWRTMQGEILVTLESIELNTRATATILLAMWNQTMGGMAAETRVGMLEINAATEAGMARNVEIVGASQVAMAGELEAGAAAGAAESGGIFSRMFGGITGIFGKVFSFLGGLGPQLFKLIFSPWGLAIAAVVGVLLLFPDQIKKAFNIVVQYIAAAAKAIYSWFSYLNPFAHHSPSLVENVTQGMAIVGAAFASVTDVQAPIMAAYNTIKTFGAAVAGLAVTAENIDFAKGLKSLTDQGGSAAAIASYKQLYAELDQLQGKASDLNDVIQQQQIVVDADKAALDAANASLTDQTNILNNLTKTQSYWDDLITKTNDDINKLSQTGIVGQQAMSDQIFANTQAQKQLQLQMMQMEDVTGPIDDATSALAALQGQIESLQGEQKTLRQAGAGSEITGGIQTQIDSLTAQQQATTQSAAAYDGLSKQLDTLQRQGQELDLENSLDFDGLTRQIQQASSAMVEMPFDQIMSGIDTDKQALAGYTAQYNAATDAVNAQQIAVDAATAQRDALSATYDTENAKLQALQDSYGKVNDAIQAINQSLQTMQDNASKASDAAKGASGGLDSGPGFASAEGTGSLSSSDSLDGLQDLIDKSKKDSADLFSGLDPLKSFKSGWKKVTDWAKTNLGSGSEFGSDVSNLVNDTEAKISSVNWSKLWSSFVDSPFVKTLEDMASSASRAAQGIAKLVAPELLKEVQSLGKFFEELWQQVGPKLMPLLSALGRDFSDLWTTIKPLAELVGIILLGAWKIFASTMNGILPPLFKLLAQTIGSMIRTLTDILDFIDNVFHGRWGKAWGDIEDIFKNMWDQILNVGTAAWNIITGAISGFINGIINFFQWLYDELVGHSIIPDMINAIVGWFLGLPGMIFGAILSLVTDIASFFLSVMSSALTAIVAGWVDVNNWFVALPGVVAGYFGAAITWLKAGGAALMTGLWQGIQSVWSTVSGFFSGIGGTIKGWFTGAIGWLASAGSDLLTGLFTGLGNAIKNAGGSVLNIASNLASGIKTGLDNVLHLPFQIPRIELPTSPWTTQGFGPWTLIPRLAMGGIFDHATQAVIGEAGREAVIPLTNPARAWDLVKASGLLSVIAPFMSDALGANSSKTMNTAWSRANASSADSNGSGTIAYTQNSESHTYNFYGDMKFPNVTNGHDVEDFLKNLEVLAGKS